MSLHVFILKSADHIIKHIVILSYCIIKIDLSDLLSHELNVRLSGLLTLPCCIFTFIHIMLRYK